VGQSLLMMVRVIVLWACWTACTIRAVPHVAARERSAALHVAACERCAAPHVAFDERCAAPHVAFDERCAAPHVVHDDRRAALDAVSYRVLLEPLVSQWSVLERLVLERLVMAAPEPQHLTPLAWWSAAQIPTRRPVREGKMRLDARSVFQSCWRSPRNLPRNNYERLVKMNAR
jgi:hypothetical protein